MHRTCNSNKNQTACNSNNQTCILGLLDKQNEATNKKGNSDRNLKIICKLNDWSCKFKIGILVTNIKKIKRTETVKERLKWKQRFHWRICKLEEWSSAYRWTPWIAHICPLTLWAFWPDGQRVPVQVPRECRRRRCLWALERDGAAAEGVFEALEESAVAAGRIVTFPLAGLEWGDDVVSCHGIKFNRI